MNSLKWKKKKKHLSETSSKAVQLHFLLCRCLRACLMSAGVGSPSGCCLWLGRWKSSEILQPVWSLCSKKSTGAVMCSHYPTWVHNMCVAFGYNTSSAFERLLKVPQEEHFFFFFFFHFQLLIKCQIGRQTSLQEVCVFKRNEWKASVFMLSIGVIHLYSSQWWGLSLWLLINQSAEW